MKVLPERRTELIGAAAFAVVVLAAFSPFVFSRRLTGEPWQVVVTFALGAFYAALGILRDDHACNRQRAAVHAYYIVQFLCVGTAILLCPARGIFFIIAMPLVSQSVFDYSWRVSALITSGLFAVSVAAFWIPFGKPVAMEVAAGFFPAFLFTLVCAIVAREAHVGKRKAEELSAELGAANERLRVHAAQAEELATTRERNRLAREIHDGVGHYLTVIKTQLDAAAALLPANPERAADSIHKAARLAGEALDDVRRSVGTLAADASRPPLLETLRQLAVDGSPMPIVHVEGTPRPLAAAAEHALFRTAQEGLTNVRKHSGATSAKLTLDFRDPARVRLVVSDNGRGTTTPIENINGTSHGLRGLRERLALLGGHLSAANGAASGFVLSAEVPCASTQDRQ